MKKTKLILIILLIIFFSIIIIMYRSDMKRMKNGQPVKYSNWGYAYSTIDTTNQDESMNSENKDVKNLEIDINYYKKDIKLNNIIIVILFILVVFTIIIIVVKFRKK